MLHVLFTLLTWIYASPIPIFLNPAVLDNAIDRYTPPPVVTALRHFFDRPYNVIYNQLENVVSKYVVGQVMKNNLAWIPDSYKPRAKGMVQGSVKKVLPLLCAGLTSSNEFVRKSAYKVQETIIRLTPSFAPSLEYHVFFQRAIYKIVCHAWKKSEL